MPIYEYECDCGNKQEEVRPMAARDEYAACDQCSCKMERIITCKIERLEPVWLDDMKHQLAPRDRKKVSTRTEWNKMLKKRGLVTI